MGRGGGKVGADEGHRCFSGGVICMQAAASSHRYASQLTSIGVGQSGNPILSAVSACEHCECFGAVGVRVVRSEITEDRPESEGERVLRCLNGSCAPIPLHLTGATSNARLLSVISQ